MEGVTEMGVDGGLVGLRPVRDDHLDGSAPAWPLFDEKPGHRSSVTMLDHGQDLAGVCVDGDVAVAFAHRGLIDQQHPTTTRPAMLGHQRRPRRDQVLDQMPVKAMAAHHSANRHDLGISDELASQPPGQTALEHAVVLEMTHVAVGTHEPAPDPHQRHTPPAHRQIPDHAPPPVMHRAALEPTEQTTRPRPSRRHLNLETRWRIDQHSKHANETQVQPHPHNVNNHRGLSGSAV